MSGFGTSGQIVPDGRYASFLPTMPSNRDIHGYHFFFFLSFFFLPILGDTKTAENTRRLRGAADVPIQSVRCRIWMIISHLIDLLGGNMPPPLPPPRYAAGQAGWLGWSGRCLLICILKPHASSITDSGMLIKIYILFCCCCCRLFCAAGQPGMHTDAKTDFGS